MAEGRKMALIPLDMLQQIKQPNLMPIKNPSQDKLIKTMDEMKNILDNDSIPKDIKSSRFNNQLKDFSVFVDKFIPQSVPPAPAPIQENVFRSLPKTFQEHDRTACRVYHGTQRSNIPRSSLNLSPILICTRWSNGGYVEVSQ